MDKHGNPLEILAEILKISHHMRSLARAESWDEFGEQEKVRQESIGKLQKVLENPVSNPESSEKMQADAIIREILELDNETRTLVEQKMADLAESFSSAGVSKQLNNAYLRP